MATNNIKLSNVIGAPFSEYVLRQLGIRAYRSSTGTLSQFGIRTNEEVLYLANKTAWVRLISSVDVIPTADGRFATLDPNAFTEEAARETFAGGLLGAQVASGYRNADGFAKNWVLEGGTSIWAGGGVDLRKGIGLNGAYGLGQTEELGYRPMPGLTSVNIETAGRLGSLRTATINFHVWNMNQLNIIEALYFRLGYSMLLEWGHTQYFKNYDGDLTTQSEEGVFVSKDIIPGVADPFVSGLRKEAIQEAIARKRYESSGNYDGMYGIVVNFNWSYNQEGGYDCSIKLVGMGAVIDSMRINQVYTLPPGILKRLETAADNINKYVQNQINQAIINERQKNNSGPGAGGATAIDPKPKNLVELRQREQTYDNFPTSATDAQFTAAYGARSAKDLRSTVIVAANVNNSYDYYSTFTTPSQGRTGTEVDAVQREYGNGLFLNGRPSGFVFVRKGYIVTLSQQGLSRFASEQRGRDQLVAGRPDRFIKGISYVDPNLNDFTSLFDYTTGYYTYVSSATGGPGALPAISEGAVDRNSPLSPYALDFNYSVKDVVFNDGSKASVYFKANWSVPAGDSDFRTTRGQFITAIQDWVLNSRQSLINDIKFTKNGSKEAIITGTFKVTLKTIFNKPGVSLDDEVVDQTTGQRVKLRERLKKLPGIQEDPNTLELFRTFEATVNFETNNPGFIEGGAAVPPAPAGGAGGSTVNAGPDPVIQQILTDNQVDASQGYESALHAMLVVIQCLTQASAVKPDETLVKTVKRYKDAKQKTKVLTVNTEAVTQEFFKGGALDGVFDVKGKEVDLANFIANFGGTFNLKLYGAKGFSGELMSDPGRFGEIPYVGQGVDPTDPTKNRASDFGSICRAMTVAYLQSNPEVGNIQFPGQFPVYIPLGYLLAFINNMCLFYDTKDNSTQATTPPANGNEKRPYVYIDFNPETNFCLTSPQQFSIDPNVCLVPVNATGSEYLEIFPENIKPAVPFDPQNRNTVTQALDSTGLNYKSLDSTYRGKTMNIMVCTQYLLKTLTQFSTGDREHAVALQPFLDRVMADINKALGNINLFRIAYRDESNTVQIQDDQYVPRLPEERTAVNRDILLRNILENAITAGELPLFASQIKGPTSAPLSVPSLGIARDMQLKTVMSTRMASKLAISAQSQTGSVNGSDHSMLSWLNQGYQDRYKPFIADPNRTQGTPPPAGSTNKTANSSKSNDLEAAEKFNDHVKSVYSTLALSEDAIEPSKNYYIERMSKVKSGDTVTSAAPPIPTEIEITLDGISGIVMGNAFLIPPQRLPRTYLDRDGYARVGFIVNGLTHRIENNEWTTQIKGQMIKLREQSGLGKTAATATGNQTGLLTFNSPSSNPPGSNPPSGPNGPVAGITSVKSDRSDPNNACYIPPWVYKERTVVIDPNSKKGKALIEVYRPAYPAGTTKGVKGLLESQIWVEGFYPGSVAYRTNNPGNIGTNTNAESYRTRRRDTLTEGIQAQIDLLNRVITGNTQSYKKDPTLYEYITQYDPPCTRDKSTNLYVRKKSSPEEVSSYTNLVLAFLKLYGITGVDGNTKLSQIVAIN